MGNPYPTQQPPRRLERSRDHRVVSGVCGGLADYLNMDPTLVRVLTVVLSTFTGVPVILYLIAMFALPEEGSSPQGYPPVDDGAGYPQPWGQPGYPTQQSYGQPGHVPAPSPQAGPGTPYGTPGGDRDVWGAQGAPWEQPTDLAAGGTNPWKATPGPDEPGPRN